MVMIENTLSFPVPLPLLDFLLISPSAERPGGKMFFGNYPLLLFFISFSLHFSPPISSEDDQRKINTNCTRWCVFFSLLPLPHTFPGKVKKRSLFFLHFLPPPSLSARMLSDKKIWTHAQGPFSPSFPSFSPFLLTISSSFFALRS